MREAKRAKGRDRLDRTHRNRMETIPRQANARGERRRGETQESQNKSKFKLMQNREINQLNLKPRKHDRELKPRNTYRVR